MSMYGGGDYGFLKIWNYAMRHHCIMLPPLYQVNNCSLLFYCFSKIYNQSVEKIKASQDFIITPEDFSSLKVESVRDLTSYVYNTSFGENKVIVIPNIDYATRSAVNALLKMIEEPPKNVHFYLLYQYDKNVLETIKSRSIIVRENISDKQHFTSLTELFGIESSYETFVSSGFNFDVYQTLMRIKNYTFDDIFQKLHGNITPNEEVEILAFVETHLFEYTKKDKNNICYAEKIFDKIIKLKKNIEHLNTNKQMYLIQLVEEFYALVI